MLESEPDQSSGRLTLTDIRRFIFDRLNTGGTKLNPQEIRNAINPGAFNELLISLTRFSLFTEVFGIPAYTESDPSDYYENPERQKNVLYSSMGDCQLVLRYFALKDDANIRGSMKSMLDRAMESRVKMTDDMAANMEKDYIARFTTLYNVFDKRPFLLAADDKGRVRVSAALYDASMVAIDKLWPQRESILNDKTNVLSRMHDALNSKAKLGVLTGQGNTAQAVRDRISLVAGILMPSFERQ